MFGRLWPNGTNVRQRPSFTMAVDDWMTQADIKRYANFQPDPWPKLNELIRVA